MTLLDLKPVSQNHVSHMIVSKAEKTWLLKALTNGFGDKMDQKDQNFGVSSATIFRAGLREHKCSDDPWE